MDLNTVFSVKLPTLNENGYYEIRLESIGGMGANLCGKLLGELGAAYLNLNAAAFSSYGSEKRGSAVKAFVRWCPREREILHNSPIENPNMLVLFHEALNKTNPVTAGVAKNTIIIVNTDKTPREVRADLKLCAEKIYCIDALKHALDTKSRINMVLLGAIVKASEFIPLEAAKQIVKDTLGKKYPAMLEQNVSGIDAGYENVAFEEFKDDEFSPLPFTNKENQWGYKNAPIGGVNPHIGSTFQNDLSPSREGFIPLFIPEKCIHCGLCDSTCPDMVFQFVKGEKNGKTAYLNRGLDYHHCKGCLRCVDVCPTEALVAGKESEHLRKEHFVRNKDLIAGSIDFEPAGADPSITGESYLTEKRVDGGQM